MNNANSDQIQSFLFLDLEATGLPHTTHRVKITEMAMISVNRQDFLVPSAKMNANNTTFNVGFSDDDGKCQQNDDETCYNSALVKKGYSPRLRFPRAMNCLNLVINPGQVIYQNVTDITGLDNYMLENQSYFNSDVVKMMESFIKRLTKPICLIAHNGVRYDYRLLKSELENKDSNVLSEVRCGESMDFFKYIDEKKRQELCKKDDDLEQASVSMEEEIKCLEIDRDETKVVDDDIDIVTPVVIACHHKLNDPSDCCLVCNPDIFIDYDMVGSDSDEKLYKMGKLNDRHTLMCRHQPGNESSCLVCTYINDKFCMDREVNFSRNKRPLTPPSRPIIKQARTPQKPKRRLFGDNKPSTTKHKLSYKLGDVYMRRFGCKMSNAHSALDDTKNLLELCLSHGEDFINYMDANAKEMDKIKSMWSPTVK